MIERKKEVKNKAKKKSLFQNSGSLKSEGILLVLAVFMILMLIMTNTFGLSMRFAFVLLIILFSVLVYLGRVAYKESGLKMGGEESIRKHPDEIAVDLNDLIEKDNPSCVKKERGPDQAEEKGKLDNMFLEALPRGLIVPNFEPKDKEEALKQIAELFFQQGIVKDKEKYHRDLINREALGSTAIGQGIALPEVTSDTDRLVAFGILISKKGVYFDALDNEPVYIFIPITGNAKKMEDSPNYLKVIARLSRLLKDKYFRDKLRQAKSSDELLNIVKDCEEILGG